MEQCFNKNENDNQNNIRDLNMLKEILEKNNNISNKEALKNMIHDIHNYLRNNGAGYGMNALKTFNILYGLKKIEEKGLLDKVNLSDECKFSYLLQLANENNDEQLAEIIYVNVLDSINNSKIKDILFYEIPKNIKGSVFSYLIKEIDKITIIEKTCNVLLSGKIYEYFIGRDESAISELGAYFTNRYIVDYILKKLDPSIIVGKISTMIDMFGGSGGFTTGYINYINQKYPNFNWENEINNIYHFDMNEDVVKSAGLEIFSLTGELPNTKSNLTYKNSFTDEFDNKRFKIILTNPPYGGDKEKKDDKKTRLKEYIKKELPTITDEETKIRREKQLKNIENQEKQTKKESNKVCLSSCSARIQKFAKDNNNLSGNDKESCSLILLMDLLEVGGTAIGVLKEGVFFNRTYKNIRKCLVEKFNVREIISVPQNQFENTSTKTSIVIFDNTLEKTSNVIFSELIVETYNEDKFEEIYGEIIITENKGDISCIRDTLISEATKEEILNNTICSLNGKEYNKKEIVVGEGYELVKLGDICESQNGYAFKTSEYNDSGIPLITITHLKNEKIVFNNNHYIKNNEKYKKYEIKKNDLIISLTGKKPNLVNIALNTVDTQLYLNQRCALLRNFTKINNYYFLCIFNGFLLNYINKYIGNGSNQENLSLTDILDLQLPIPKSTQKITEWVDKISKPYDKKNKNQELIMKLEEDIKNKIKDIEENEECDEVELGNICELLSGTKHCTNIAKKNGYYKFYNSSQDSNLYVDFCEINEYSIIIGQGGVISIHYDINFTPSKHVCVLQINNKNYLQLEYIYYFLVNHLSNFKTNGSTIQWLNKTNIKLIKIKIPKDKKLINNFEPLFNEIEKLQIELKKAELEYTQLIKELAEEAIPINKILYNNEDVEEILSNNEEVEENKNNDDKPINLEKQSKKELEKICKDKNIPFIKKDTKKILIEKIKNHKD